MRWSQNHAIFDYTIKAVGLKEPASAIPIYARIAQFAEKAAQFMAVSLRETSTPRMSSTPQNIARWPPSRRLLFVQCADCWIGCGGLGWPPRRNFVRRLSRQIVGRRWSIWFMRRRWHFRSWAAWRFGRRFAWITWCRGLYLRRLDWHQHLPLCRGVELDCYRLSVIFKQATHRGLGCQALNLTAVGRKNRQSTSPRQAQPDPMHFHSRTWAQR